MTTIRYTYQRSVNGVEIIVDLECEVECTVTVSGGEPEWEVDTVYVVNSGNRTDLTQADDVSMQALGFEILDAVENDHDAFERAVEAAGIVYHGRGGNDPEGYCAWGEYA